MDAAKENPLQNQPESQEPKSPDLQSSETPSHAHDPNLQSPSPDEEGEDLGDEEAEQIICKELQNLVLNLALSEEKARVLEGSEIWNREDEDAGSVGPEVANHDQCWSENGDGNDKEGEVVGEGGEESHMDGVRRRRLSFQSQYPLRPDAEDCAYYMKTGSCKFGSNCKFNHPARRSTQGTRGLVGLKEENLEIPGQIECKYYLTSGGCKYGKACKYNHSREEAAAAPVVELNFLGLPIRPAEKECPYYMRTGSCKYESSCRFHHPDPSTVAGDSSEYSNGGSFSLQVASHQTISPWSSPRALNDTTPFVPVIYSNNQGVSSPHPEWNGYQVPIYPTSERSLPTPPAFSMNNPATGTNFYPRYQQSMLVDEYPERPGLPECSYFLKTGDCKYKSNCKFHHPKDRMSKSTSCILSDKGLPLRPDQAMCSHYRRYGICKFGPACKYNHPDQGDGSMSTMGSDLDHPAYSNSASEDGTILSMQGNKGGSLIQQSA